jgi:hypothetical protein
LGKNLKIFLGVVQLPIDTSYGAVRRFDMASITARLFILTIIILARMAMEHGNTPVWWLSLLG